VTDNAASPQHAPDARGGWTPIPDPTVLTTEAVTRAIDIFRREIQALHELHDKDMTAMRDLLGVRLDAMDIDRTRLWERTHELTKESDENLTRFRAEVERRDQAGRQLIEQRLEDLDKARALNAKHIDLIPDRIDCRVAAEREYLMSQLNIIATRTSEKFGAVDKEFLASKEAVAAALQAAKEAVGEQNRSNSAAIKVSESNTKEQLTALGQVSSANFKAQEDKINDARERITAMESLTRGIREAAGEARDVTHFGQTFEQTARIAAASQQRANISTIIAGISILVAVIAVIIPLILKQ
jgi:hypothetical protein